MQWNRWEKRWSYEKLEMKTKQIFGKTFQKTGLGVWAYREFFEFTSHLEETSSLQTSRRPLRADHINAVPPLGEEMELRKVGNENKTNFW